jgi:ankyrin repeat protein
MLAAIQGRTACAVALMNHSHLSAQNKKGETAFMIAVQGAWLSLAKKLRQKGSDVNLHTKTGSAPLMVCARDNMWALYDSIGSGMDLNYKDHEGWTALMHAARYDNVEMVERLIAAGADTLTQDESGYCALSHAARSNALRTAALLLNSVSALQADEDGRTPLMHAARMGHLDMVKLLIPWSDISQVNERGWTAADIAFKEGEHDVFELLAAYQISTLERHQLEELCDPVHALDPMVMRV